MYSKCLYRGLIFTAFILLTITSPVSATTPTPLKIGYIPLVSQLPLIISYYYDQFRFVSVQPSLSQYSSFTSLEAAFRVGAIDTALVPIPAALSMAADNLEIKLLGQVSRGGSLLVAKNLGDYNYLKDKVIGVPGLDSNENLYLKETLARSDLRYGLDYKTVGIPINSALEHLTTGGVDALYYPEPYGTIALNTHSAFAIQDQGKDLSARNLYVLIIHSDFLKVEKKYGVLEWLQSIAKACKTLQDQACNEELEKIPLLEFDNGIVEFSLKHKIGGIEFGLYPIDLTDLWKNMDGIIELKILFKSVALDSLVDFDLFQEVLGEVNK